MLLLSLKDLVIFTISRYPAKAFGLPSDVIRKLYLGFYFSPIMHNLLVCPSCKKARPCVLHDHKMACSGLTLGGMRCNRSTRGSNFKYCYYHSNAGQCRRMHCKKQGLTRKIQLCWEHYRQNKCPAIDYNNRYCQRMAGYHGRCKYHQEETNPDYQCSRPNCKYTIRSHNNHCSMCWRMKHNNICRSLCHNHRERCAYKIPDVPVKCNTPDKSSLINRYMVLAQFEV